MIGSIKGQFQWYLKGKLKDNSPWIVPIYGLAFTIGRREDCDLILASPSVSRRHGEFIAQGDDLYLSDLDSKNGISINGKRQKEQLLLKRGDLIKIGGYEFSLCQKATILEDEREQTLARAEGTTQISFSDLHHLSEREREILYFLIRGQTLQQIGESLFISPGTVKNHVLKIYKKTDCHSRIELSTMYSEFKE